MSPAIATQLLALGIEIAAQAKEYVMLVRGTCVALARMDAAGSVSIGSSGLMTENGLSYLVWRDGKAILSIHGGSETDALQEQVEAIRKFSDDLKTALDLPLNA